MTTLLERVHDARNAPRTPLASALDESGNRVYTWTGRGRIEQFYSVTTLLQLGLPKYLVPWASKLIAEATYADVEQHGKKALKVWAREGRAYLDECRANGMKLERADETPKGLALRWLKGEPDRVRDKAAARGSAVHEAAEDTVLERVREAERLYIAGEMPVFDAGIDPYMQSFIRWLNDFRPRFVATEATVYNRSQWYAGTLDAIVEVLVDGEWIRLVVDYKSGRNIYPEVALQCAAYARGEFIGGADGVTEFPVPAVDGTAVLHLTPKGYRFRRLRYDDQVYRTFLYTREVARWALNGSKTAIGDPIPQDLSDALEASVGVS